MREAITTVNTMDIRGAIVSAVAVDQPISVATLGGGLRPERREEKLSKSTEKNWKKKSKL